jgi:Holliday junction resolvase
MTNQKARGTRAEVAVWDDLGTAGYDVIRSAASKGASDLVAVHDGEILFVQVKLGAQDRPFKMPSPAERAELIRIAERARGFPVAVCVVPGAGARKQRILYRLLTGPGPRECLTWTPRGPE